MLQAYGRVVRDQPGSEQFEGEADASGQQGQGGHDEDRTERPELHDHPEEAVEPSRQTVEQVEQRRLETRHPGEGGDEAAPGQRDRTEPEPDDVTRVPGARDIRSGGHPHTWILTPFDYPSKAEAGATSQV